MCGDGQSCSGNHAPATVKMPLTPLTTPTNVSAFTPSTMAPMTPDTLFNNGKFVLETNGTDGSLSITYKPELLEFHPAVGYLSVVSDWRLYQPGGSIFGAFALGQVSGGLSNISNACKTDWLSSAAKAKDEISSCLGGLGSNLSSLASACSTSSIVPLALGGMALGAAAYAWSRYETASTDKSLKTSNTSLKTKSSNASGKANKVVTAGRKTCGSGCGHQH